MNHERHYPMNGKEQLPKSVIESYDVFNNDSFRLVKYFVPTVPAAPDTTYSLYENADKLYALVATDYPSPLDHSREFFKLSHKYIFDSLLTPGAAEEPIQILKDDEMGLDFFVKDNQTYYYCANVINVEDPQDTRNPL